MHLIEVELTEFEGLCQTVILGCPYLDMIGGMEMDPDRIRMSGIWYPRGGIPIDIFWQTKNIPKGCLVPELNFSPYRGRD